MSLREKFEKLGAVVTLCSAALILAKLYRILHTRQIQRQLQIEDQKTYDLVVNINGDPNRSDWELQIFKEHVPKEEVAVAVFGDFNVGKTYIINKMSGLALPSGETDHTIGISIKNTNHGILWIDTAGMGAPYCVRSQTPEERYGTEHLIGELAYRLSDAQIVVVSHCSVRDQEFISALHNWQIHENRPGKNLLIIVHNYCRISDPELLRLAFLNDVVSKFGIEEITLPDRSNPKRQQKVWLDKGDGYPIYHVLLGYEGTPAGAKYNESTFNSIFNLCVSRLGFGTYQHVLDNAIRDLNEDLLQKYFNTQTRLRLNEVRTKLVPVEEFLCNSVDSYSFKMDNGGALSSRSINAPMLSSFSSFSKPPPQHIDMGNSGHARAAPLVDARTAIRDVLKHIGTMEDDPITKLEFKF